MYLDGIVLKRSWAGEVRNISLLVAIGVNSDGYREILGICEGAKEDKAGWSAFLKHLKERGLNGVRLTNIGCLYGRCRRALPGWPFPDAAWQRCVVHWYRNIFPVLCPSGNQGAGRSRPCSKRSTPARTSWRPARRAVRVIEKLRGLRLSRAAELVEMAADETLTYYAFPEEHWRRIRTNNPTRAHPARDQAPHPRGRRISGRAIRPQPGRGQGCATSPAPRGSTKRYLNIELLKDQQMRGAITA